MRNYLPLLLASGLLAAGLSYSTLPAQAGIANHLPSKAIETTQNADVIQVRDHHRRYDRRHYDRRPNYRRHHHPRPRYVAPRPGFSIEFGTRPVYRPAPIYRPAPVYRAPARGYSMSQAHVNWCASRYRSYRAYDNSFQPYNGPRRACVSPYGR